MLHNIKIFSSPPCPNATLHNSVNINLVHVFVFVAHIVSNNQSCLLLKLLLHFYKYAIKTRQLDFSLNVVYQNSQLYSSGLFF